MNTVEIKKIAICLCVGMITVSTSVLAKGQPEWQLNRLMNPTQQNVQFEQKHQKVFIYDGLYSHDIDRAMDQQFARIDNMMFVRVKVATDDGVEVQEDNCD